MNKTVTINLSGIVFHIDENAFELLKKYLEKLKQHFASTQGKEEIIADIEGRMAEMFMEKNADNNKVIMATDVNEIIEAMGKPEDLPGDEEELKGAPKASTVYYESVTKRFFRNQEDRVIGGVCSGIGAYFDIDPIWIRLAFILLAVAALGTGLLIYIILWIIVPLANTPSEKLQMRGERVNVANIEKNIREEFESLKKKGEAFTDEITSEETKRRVRTSAQKIGDFIGDILRGLGRFIAFIFGIFITLGSLVVLVGLTIAIFGGIGIFNFTLPHQVTSMVLTNLQLWWLIIGGLLAIGIPFTLLFLNGLKILFKIKLNLKMIGLVLAGFWLVGIGICVLVGIRIASEYQRSATIKESQMITTAANTVAVKAVKNPFFGHEGYGDVEIFGDLFMTDENGDSVTNRMVRFDISPSDNDSMYLITRIYSRGKTYDDAKRLAHEINYRYSVTDSVIMLPDYFNMNTETKYRGQNVKLVLMVPEGKSVILDKSLGEMLDGVANVTDTWDWDMLGHEWKMTKDGLECQDCPSDKNDHDEVPEKTDVEIGPVDIHVESSTSN